MRSYLVGGPRDPVPVVPVPRTLLVHRNQQGVLLIGQQYGVRSNVLF